MSHPAAGEKRTVLACDIGGTTMKMGLVRDNEVVGRAEIRSEPARGLAHALERLKARALSVLRESGVQLNELYGVGLAFPGIVEPRTERILSSPAGKFDDAASLNVHQWVLGHFAVPAVICNDANAALAGEAVAGAARGFRSVVMITLGTGFGSSAIIDGIPLRGQHGSAGSLGGHLLANVHGGLCPCGNLGCVETAASTWALPELLAAHPRAATSALLREPSLGYEAVFRHAAGGDAVARDLRDESLRVWGAAVVSLIHAYDPELVVIGGGLMRSAETILPVIQTYVRKHAWTPWGNVRVVSADCGGDAALIGMAELLRRKLSLLSS